MNNQIRTFYQNCEKCQEQAAAKPRQVPVLPDDLTKMGPMEMCGVDLMELRGKNYLVMCDKKSGYRFCAYMTRTATSDVTAILEKCFFHFAYLVVFAQMVVLNFDKNSGGGAKN